MTVHFQNQNADKGYTICRDSIDMLMIPAADTTSNVDLVDCPACRKILISVGLIEQKGEKAKPTQPPAARTVPESIELKFPNKEYYTPFESAWIQLLLLAPKSSEAGRMHFDCYGWSISAELVTRRIHFQGQMGPVCGSNMTCGEKSQVDILGVNCPSCQSFLQKFVRDVVAKANTPTTHYIDPHSGDVAICGASHYAGTAKQTSNDLASVDCHTCLRAAHRQLHDLIAKIPREPLS